VGFEDRSGQGSLPIKERIRRRREDRKMTGAELADRVGISAAYISLIERGKKVPRVSKAVKIAEVLEDDPAPYRLWALMRRGAEASSWGDLTRSMSYARDVQLRRRLSSGEDLPSPEAPEEAVPLAAGRRVERPDRRRALARAPPADRIVEVPVLEPGVDPASGPEIPEELVQDRLLIDGALLRGDRLLRPFAFRAGGGTTARLQGEARPGDWVVVSSAVGKLVPDAIYVVRVGRGLVLSHVVSKGSTLLLPGGEARRDIEVIEVGEEGPLAHLAGRVAIVVRRP
jgi:transcriptional regulator with XRE-family HTH domain